MDPLLYKKLDWEVTQGLDLLHHEAFQVGAGWGWWCYTYLMLAYICPWNGSQRAQARRQAPRPSRTLPPPTPRVIPPTHSNARAR